MTLAASLLAQMAAIDAQMSAISPTSVGSDGVSATNPDWLRLSNQRMKLEHYYNRLSGTNPMFTRGYVIGLKTGR